MIKIDVQGFEAKVLEGAVATIERDHPAVFCEITPEALKKAGSSVDEVLAFFQDRGYAARILSDDGTPPKSAGYPALLDLFATSGAEYHDILFEVSA